MNTRTKYMEKCNVCNVSSALKVKALVPILTNQEKNKGTDDTQCYSATKTSKLYEK